MQCCWLAGELAVMGRGRVLLARGMASFTLAARSQSSYPSALAVLNDHAPPPPPAAVVLVRRLSAATDAGASSLLPLLPSFC